PANTTLLRVSPPTFPPPANTPFAATPGLSPGAIHYEYADTSSLTVNTGSGAAVDVLATGVATTLVGHGPTTVNVGNSVSGVRDIFGPLTITNPTNITTLDVDDSADTIPRLASPFTFTPPVRTPA